MDAPPVVPAAVSAALPVVFDHEPRPAVVLGTAAPAVWLSGPGGVVMVSTSDAVRLPNSLVIGSPASSEPFCGIAPGEEAMLGGGAVAGGDAHDHVVVSDVAGLGGMDGQRGRGRAGDVAVVDERHAVAAPLVREGQPALGRGDDIELRRIAGIDDRANGLGDDGRRDIRGTCVQENQVLVAKKGRVHEIDAIVAVEVGGQ